MYNPQPQVARARVPYPLDTDRSNAADGSLETSLLQLIDDHQHISFKHCQQTEIAKKDAIRNAMRVSQLLVDAVNGGMQDCFINEKRIESETRALAATIVRFAKLTDQWLAVSHAINTAVKEFGDFENWMKTMEFDCKSINAAISNIHQS